MNAEWRERGGKLGAGWEKRNMGKDSKQLYGRRSSYATGGRGSETFFSCDPRGRVRVTRKARPLRKGGFAVDVARIGEKGGVLPPKNRISSPHWEKEKREKGGRNGSWKQSDPFPDPDGTLAQEKGGT